DQDCDEDEDGDEEREVRRRALALVLVSRQLDVEGDAARLRDTADHARRADQQALAVSAVAELRDHVLAARFSRKSIRDEFFEAVADFDPDAALLEREQDQQAVVLPLVADALAAVLEQL